MIKRKEMLVTTQNAVVVLVIETKEEVSSRIGRNFPLFLHLVLRYMSLYKYILNARPFISAFSLFFFFFLLCYTTTTRTTSRCRLVSSL
jgi:hypothetical protein